MRAICIGVVLLAACGDDGAVRPPGALGRVAFSEAGTGALVVMDVETGARVERTFEEGAPGAIAFEPSGGHIAFALERSLDSRRLFVADAEELAAHEVTPGFGFYAPSIRWGAGSFSYISETGPPEPELRLATPADHESRAVVTGTGRILPLPTGEYVVARCTTDVAHGCAPELVVEDVTGANRRVIATGPGRLWPAALLEDAVVVYEDDGESTQLVVRDLATGAPRPLGEYPWFDLAPQGPNLSSVAPDASEILTTDGANLVAVRLDGSGARVVAAVTPYRAGFTARGDIVFQAAVYVGEAGEGEYRYDLFVARGREVVKLIDGAKSCHNDALVSPTGNVVAWSCDAGTQVFSLDDDALLSTHPQGEVIGFTPDGASMVAIGLLDGISEKTVWLWGHDGAERVLGSSAFLTTEHGEAEWPPAGYSAH